MAYIVGIVTASERSELERRGWEAEPCPAELVPEGADADDYALYFVDAAVFDVMDGPDWEKG
jgi:hypothetical protein